MASDFNPVETNHTTVLTSLKRLHNQLRVDCAIEVHGNGEKRKREPTRSIYEEATANLKKDNEKSSSKKKKMRMNKINKPVAIASKKFPHKKTPKFTKSKTEASTDFSGIEDSTDPYTTKDEDNQRLLMMHAATSLAQLSKRVEEEATNGGSPHTEKFTIEALTKAHKDALRAKDEAIKAATAALAAKDELLKTQAALITMMQQGHVAVHPKE